MSHKKSRSADKKKEGRNPFSVETLTPDGRAQLALIFGSGRHWSENSVAGCCPPGSLLSSIAEQWHCGTSIPLEIPVAIALTIISGELAARNITLNVADADVVSPELWWIILAHSGCGKSWTLTKLRKAFRSSYEIDATGCVSTAALFRRLSDSPRGWWICDEWGGMLRQLERTASPLAEAKGLLLRIYNGESASRDRANREDSAVIERPALALAGVTVDETFTSIMSTESLLDGFGSRFAYAYGTRDRDWLDFPTWVVETSAIAQEWESITRRIQPRYETSQEIFERFEAGFRRMHQTLLSSGSDVPEAFFRRVLHRHHKLALICHVVTHPEDPCLTNADYDTAERIVAWQLRDGRRLIDSISQGQLGILISRAMEWAERRKAGGKSISRRDLVAGVRGIDSVANAEFILRCVGESVAAQHPIP